jgi:hypothetical protein
VVRVSDKKAASKSRKRKPYSPPTLKQLSPEAAKALLEAKAIPGDKEAEKLLKEIRRKLGTD